MACDTVCVAGCFQPGSYYVNVRATQPTPCAQSHYNLSLQCLPCSRCAQCDPASDIPEGETCFNFPDTYNGGCTNGQVHTTPIHCGDAICGTLSSDNTNLDRDVYSITTTTYDSLIWCVEFGRYAAAVQIVQPIAGGCSGVVTIAQNNTYTGCDVVCARACVPPGTYWLIVQAQQYGLNCETYVAHLNCLPCDTGCVFCPQAGRPENEPCPNIPDNYNGGCYWGPPTAMPVNCGDIICGTSTSYDFPDHDFFQITLTAPDSIVWCVKAEYPVQVAIYNPVANCANLVPIVQNFGPECAVVCASVCLSPGTYWLYTSPTGNLFNQCKRYVASVRCFPCTPQILCNYPNYDFDPANNTCNATPVAITCPDTLCGVIQPVGDVDWYTLILPPPGCYNVSIDIFGHSTPGWFPYQQGLNPQVWLYQNDCVTQVGYDDDSGVGADSRLDSLCLPAGVYQIKVTGQIFNGAMTQGPYILATGCTPCACDTCPYADLDFDPQNDNCPPPLPPLLHCQDTLCGEINPLGDVDWYALDIPASVGCVLLDIDVFADATPGWYPFGQGLNPQLWLYRSDCVTQVGYDNDGGVGTDSHLATACLMPGRYFIRIDGLGQVGTATQGPYILAISCSLCLCDTCLFPNVDLEPQNNTCQPSPVTVTCGDTLCGRIFQPGAVDVDWYQLQIPGPNCTRVIINVYGNDTPGWYPYGLGLDPRVSLWASDCSTLLGFDDNSGVGNDATMGSPCLQPGMYFIRIEGVGGTTGPYVFTLTCDSCACPCDVVCPPNFPGDGEACPNFGTDTYNGGCASVQPPFFGTMLCNYRFCGTCFAMGGIVDTDWFQLTLTQARRIRWNVQAEFPFEINIFRPNPDCSNLVTIRHVTGNPCDIKQAFVSCLAAGTYYFEIAPTVTNGVPCSDYISRLRCGKCFIHDVVVVLVNNNSNLRLMWSPDETLPVYNVYRSSDSNVEPIGANLVASTADTTWLDTEIRTRPGTKFFYTVTMQNPDTTQPGGP